MTLRAELLEIYDCLEAAYGPQHWWPGDTPFEVIVGAILTQSAAWANVEKCIDNLKAEYALSPKALREMPLQKLAQLVYPSGYYNAKAAKVKAFVDWLGDEHGDNEYDKNDSSSEQRESAPLDNAPPRWIYLKSFFFSNVFPPCMMALICACDGWRYQPTSIEHH